MKEILRLMINIFIVELVPQHSPSHLVCYDLGLNTKDVPGFQHLAADFCPGRACSLLCPLYTNTHIDTHNEG